MSETAARSLVVMRHGKAESSASSDHERDLTDRGRRDSRAAGAWLAANHLTPDVVLVSSAVRALSTSEEVCSGLGSDPDVRVLDALYGADEEEVVATCVAEIPSGATCALVIGHNPTMALTVGLLQPEDDRREVSLPTAALAVVAVPADWSELAASRGALQQVHTPHD